MHPLKLVRPPKTVKMPWQGGERLVSLAFMQTYLARHLLSIPACIRTCLKYCQNETRPEHPFIEDREMKQALGHLTESLAFLGLRISQSAARKIESDFGVGVHVYDPDAAKHLNLSFQSEVEDIKFLHLKPNEWEFWERSEKEFFKGCDVAFPSAFYDATEAVKCLALGRHTAVVMHSMRLVEPGLRALCDALQIPFEQKTWGSIIGDLETKWRQLETVSPKPPKEDSQFYHEAFADFRHFKEAWRDRVFHSSRKYGENEARDILERVRSFMQHLAKRLKETA